MAFYKGEPIPRLAHVPLVRFAEHRADWQLQIIGGRCYENVRKLRELSGNPTKKSLSASQMQYGYARHRCPHQDLRCANETGPASAVTVSCSGARNYEPTAGYVFTRCLNHRARPTTLTESRRRTAPRPSGSLARPGANRRVRSRMDYLARRRDRMLVA